MIDPTINSQKTVFGMSESLENKTKKRKIRSELIKQATPPEDNQISADKAIKDVREWAVSHKAKPDVVNKLDAVNKLSDHHVVVTSHIFKKLLPEGFLDEIQKGKSGSPELWNRDPNFDPSLLDHLLLAFSEHRVSKIESVHGVEYHNIQYNSILSKKLNVKIQDLTKSEIVGAAFKHCSGLEKKDYEELEKIIIKYIDYIGVNQLNINKIIKKNTKTQHIIDSPQNAKMISQFLNEVSIKMKKEIDDKIRDGDSQRLSLGVEVIKEDTIVITTTSSGGAHRSIANVIDQSLKGREIPHVIVNESDLVPEDNLKKFIAIPRSDIYNKVSQQSGEMEYGKKLKKLDDYLSQFSPDNYMNEMRKSVGNSRFIVSTSHHPENIRLVAENSKRICFQVCDFGELPDKLEKIAKTTSKYNLKGITFFTPSTHSKLKIKEHHPLAEPGKGQKERIQTNEVPVPTDRHEMEKKKSTEKLINAEAKFNKRLENYKKFTQTQRYPVHQAFLKEDKDFTKEIKQKYDIREDTKLWILTMGSQGVGGVLKDYITSIIRGKLDDMMERDDVEKLDVAVLCGTNQSLVGELRQFCNNEIDKMCQNLDNPEAAQKLKEILAFQPLGRLELPEVAALGKSCSAFLSKPGGGTTAEALMGGFPMLIHREKKHVWEFGNINTLLDSGATEVSSIDNFYQQAKNVTPLKTPDLLAEEDAVDYAINALWGIEMERPKHNRPGL